LRSSRSSCHWCPMIMETPLKQVCVLDCILLLHCAHALLSHDQPINPHQPSPPQTSINLHPLETTATPLKGVTSTSATVIRASIGHTNDIDFFTIYIPARSTLKLGLALVPPLLPASAGRSNLYAELKLWGPGRQVVQSWNGGGDLLSGAWAVQVSNPVSTAHSYSRGLVGHRVATGTSRSCTGGIYGYQINIVY